MKRRISTVGLTVALVLTACSGDAEPQAANPETGRTVQIPATTTTTTSVPPSTTTTILAPSTLAFSSSADVGRLFSLNRDITASTQPGGEADASAIGAGTIVQTSNLRSTDGTMWVRVEATTPDGPTLGWVPVDAISPTAESVFYENRQTARELRQVTRAVNDGVLNLLPSPGAGAPIASLAQDEIAMHGGVTGLAPSGEDWVDVIDPATGSRLGWVPARSFTRIRGGLLQDLSLIHI